MTGAVIAIAVVLIVVGGITGSVIAYFRLQRHRADAPALAEYRRLAEESVAQQESLRGQLAELEARLKGVETLLRSVD
ncbi:hypothetical protein [Streptomyces sp. NPDC014733]|uniref:hypothetical protein n=1 Tax=Streptomyces sp. NPDC014733 TaxID=3364885 RepID=UPI0036F6E7EB